MAINWWLVDKIAAFTNEDSLKNYFFFSTNQVYFSQFSISKNSTITKLMLRVFGSSMCLYNNNKKYL